MSQPPSPKEKTGETLSQVLSFGKDEFSETKSVSGENIDPYLTSLNRRAFSGLSSIARSLLTRASTSESS